MDQREFLNRMAAAQRARESGTEVEEDAKLRKFLDAQSSEKGWDLPVGVGRPDPEAAADAQIQKAVDRPVDVNSVVRQGEARQINPETGMPFFGAAPQVSPEEEKRRKEMELKTQFLRQRASGN